MVLNIHLSTSCITTKPTTIQKRATSCKQKFEFFIMIINFKRNWKNILQPEIFYDA